MGDALNSAWPSDPSEVAASLAAGAEVDLDWVQRVLEAELSDARASGPKVLASIADAIQLQLELTPPSARAAFLEGELLRRELRPFAEEACGILVRVSQAGPVPAGDLARATELRDSIRALQQQARGLAAPVGPHLAEGEVARALMSCESILEGGQELGFREVARMFQDSWSQTAKGQQ